MTAASKTPRGRYKKTDALIEDVEFLIEAGCTWHEIPTRLNRTPQAAERALARAGRPDLVHLARTMNERRANARAS
ncbi:hypothetical protein [Arthrobacter sp. MP_2.3]|uniref:hypothetical protein n=1 Tax=Arthrobacter sp. MP_2.3 TaxID=3349633 RepID=UPI0038D3911F